MTQLPEDRTYRDRVVRLAEFVRLEFPSEADRLGELVFVDCHIEGPAVVYPLGCQFMECSWGVDPSTLEGMLWDLASERRNVLIGAIVLDHCLFERCKFDRVGIVAEPHVLDQVRQGLLRPGGGEA